MAPCGLQSALLIFVSFSSAPFLSLYDFSHLLWFPGLSLCFLLSVKIILHIVIKGEALETCIHIDY